jgi:hypothetical protein
MANNGMKKFVGVLHGGFEGVVCFLLGLAQMFYPQIYNFLFSVDAYETEYGIGSFGAMNVGFCFSVMYYVYLATYCNKYAEFKRFARLSCLYDIAYIIENVMYLSRFGPMLMIPIVLDLVLLTSKFILFVCGYADKFYEYESLP